VLIVSNILSIICFIIYKILLPSMKNVYLNSHITIRIQVKQDTQHQQSVPLYSLVKDKIWLPYMYNHFSEYRGRLDAV